MTNPNEVSAAAWAFAVRMRYPIHGEPTSQTYQSRIALARAFDAAAKPLRELASDIPAKCLNSESWNARLATLAQFTPDKEPDA